MDTLLLALALRAAAQPVTGRICPAAILGAGYALACALRPEPWLRSMAAQGVVMLLMLLIASDRAAGKLRLTAAMAMGTLLMGGLLEIALKRWPGLTGFLGAVTLGCVLLWMAQDRRRMHLRGLTIRVSVRQGERRARFEALIDTGNRLQEPFSGLPVLIAEERLVAQVLPTDGRPLRRIPYGGLGGCGFLEAFRPDSLHFAREAGWQRAPEVWIAVYPGRMSGQIHALAPPVFAMENMKNSRWIREERL